MQDRDLKADFRRALDAVSPPAPWLAASVRAGLRERRSEKWFDRLRRQPRPMRFALVTVPITVVAIVVGASFLLAQLYIPAQRTTPGAPVGLTPTQEAQLAQLELRPIKLPPLAAADPCPAGPGSTIKPYRDGRRYAVGGNGPVFVEGGPRTDTPKNAYFDVVFFTDPTVRGVVLIRGVQIDGRLSVVYVGNYAAGAIVGSDTIDGKRVDLYSEAAVVADHPPSDASAAPGWGIWHIRQGIDQSYWGCTVFQFDFLSGTEQVVTYDVSAGGTRS